VAGQMVGARFKRRMVHGRKASKRQP
jgi:hypothetical protein